MKNKKIQITILILMLIIYSSSVKALDDLNDGKGFYFGVNPGFSYFQSFSTPSSQNIGYGLGLRLGGHFNNRITVYGFFDTMAYFVSDDEFAASLDMGPAVKYVFSKNRNWFLTGGIGVSYAAAGGDDTVAGMHSIFISTGLGYDFKMGRKSFVSPELNLKFYTNQNQRNPFSFSAGSGVEQAIQAKIAVNFGWYF